MTVRSMVRRMMMKPPFPDQEADVSAILETFMRVVSKGRTMGKLRIAISEKLLLARDAMAAIMVSTEERPKLPSSNAVRKRVRLTTRFPIRSRNRRKERPERTVIRRRLYTTFEIRIPCGLARV